MKLSNAARNCLNQAASRNLLAEVLESKEHAAIVAEIVDEQPLVVLCGCNMCKIGNPYCQQKFSGPDYQFIQSIGA